MLVKRTNKKPTFDKWRLFLFTRVRNTQVAFMLLRSFPMKSTEMEGRVLRWFEEIVDQFCRDRDQQPKGARKVPDGFSAWRKDRINWIRDVCLGCGFDAREVDAFIEKGIDHAARYLNS